MTDASNSNPFEQFFTMLSSWPNPALGASRSYAQSILPGWSFLSVNEGNSAAPDTEQAIVAKASYGRQLGRIMDAVEELVAERPPSAAKKKAFTELHDLAVSVEQAKVDAAKARVGRLKSDLALLKTSDPGEYRIQRDALTAFLKID